MTIVWQIETSPRTAHLDRIYQQAAVTIQELPENNN